MHSKDSRSQGPSLQFFLEMCEFLEMFPNELFGIPLDRKINFGIDLPPDTYPISIPPYRMAPDELKKLKE